MAAARDGFEELSAQDQAMFRRLSENYVASKRTAEFLCHRPWRFSFVHDLGPDAPLPEGAKRLHLVRHGQGEHNVFREQEHAAGRTPLAKRGNFQEVPRRLLDPLLTEKGLAEAVAAQRDALGSAPQLLVTSPVRRAVQTCLAAFKDAVDRGVPVLAHELCREQLRGSDPSVYDAHLGRSKLAKEFPQVDFSRYVLPESFGTDMAAAAVPAVPAATLELAEDPMWWACGTPMGACGEDGPTEAAATENAYGFLSWLMSRPESEIGVASHSIFLLSLYYGAIDNPGQSGVRVFHTGELRTVVVLKRPAPQAPKGASSLASFREAMLGAGLSEGGSGGDPDCESQPAKRAR